MDKRYEILTIYSCHFRDEKGIKLYQASLSKLKLSLTAISKGHAKAYSLGPDDTALLPDRTIKQLEAAGQIALPANFEAGTARRVIDDAAIDRGRFGTENDFGRPAHVSRWTNPFVEPRMCHLTPLNGRRALVPLQIVVPIKSGDRANVPLMLPTMVAIA